MIIARCLVCVVISAHCVSVCVCFFGVAGGHGYKFVIILILLGKNV